MVKVLEYRDIAKNKYSITDEGVVTNLKPERLLTTTIRRIILDIVELHYAQKLRNQRNINYIVLSWQHSLMIVN